jgi:hypothetical protein
MEFDDRSSSIEDSTSIWERDAFFGVQIRQQNHIDVQGLFARTERVLQLPNVDRDPIGRWGFSRVTLIGDAVVSGGIAVINPPTDVARLFPADARPVLFVTSQVGLILYMFCVGLEFRVDLVESHQRKAVFLREAIRGLPNVRVLAQRAEDVSEQYDWVVSRAVRPRDVISQGLAPNSALLVSAGDADSAQVIPVPHSDQRVVAMFHVELQSGFGGT